MLKITKHVLTILFLFFLNFGRTVHADAALREKEEWDMEDVKIFLKLPYTKLFEMPNKQIDFKFFDGLRGLSSFAIIPEGFQSYDSKGVQMKVCTSDLTVFEVSLSRPESCKSACDMILEMAAGLIPVRKNMRDYFFPKYDNIAGVYSLVNNLVPRLWCLDTKNGIFINVSYNSESQVLKAPANREVLIKQMNLVVDGLLAELNAPQINPNTNDDYYKSLVVEYLEVLKKRDITEVPANAVKIDLLLSVVPTQEQTENGYLHNINKPMNVIAGEPYLLSTFDGKAFPLVKIADAADVTSIITPRAEAFELQSISDIRVQQSFENIFDTAEAALRTDGHYELRLHGSGKTIIRVLYLNRSGQIVQFGEVAVELIPSSEIPPKQRNRK
jgi:hypothetical protein